MHNELDGKKSIKFVFRMCTPLTNYHIFLYLFIAFFFTLAHIYRKICCISLGLITAFFHVHKSTTICQQPNVHRPIFGWNCDFSCSFNTLEMFVISKHSKTPSPIYICIYLVMGLSFFSIFSITHFSRRMCFWFLFLFLLSRSILISL